MVYMICLTLDFGGCGVVLKHDITPERQGQRQEAVGEWKG